MENKEIFKDWVGYMGSEGMVKVTIKAETERGLELFKSILDNHLKKGVSSFLTVDNPKDLYTDSFFDNND